MFYTCLQNSPQTIVFQSNTVGEVEVGEVQLQVESLPLLQTETLLLQTGSLLQTETLSSLLLQTETREAEVGLMD